MRPILAVTLGIVLLFAGLWIGHRIAATEDARPPEPLATNVGAAGHDQDVARSIAALGDEIRRLREEIESRSTASETRVPADGSLAELARRTQTLEALVERMNSTRSASGSGLSSGPTLRDIKKAPGYPSRADLFRDVEVLASLRPPDESLDTQAWDAWSAKAEEARIRWASGHLNWSLQELIDRYGQPDSVENTGQVLSLIFVGEQADGSPVTFHFCTRNGFVIDVRCEGKGV